MCSLQSIFFIFVQAFQKAIFKSCLFSAHSNTALVEDIILRLYYLYFFFVAIFTYDFQNTRWFKPEQRRDVEHFVVGALGGLTGLRLHQKPATACLKKGKGCSAEMFVIR